MTLYYTVNTVLTELANGLFEVEFKQLTIYIVDDGKLKHLHYADLPHEADCLSYVREWASDKDYDNIIGV